MHSRTQPKHGRARAAGTRRRVIARIAPLFLVAGIAVATTPFAPTAARAAGARTLTVTPATALGNQVVLVHWTGFTPTSGFSYKVTIYECKANPHQINHDLNSATADDCYTAAPPTGNAVLAKGTTQADGTGSAFIEILPAAQLPLLNCSTTNPCSLVAYEENGTPPPADSLPASAVTAPLTFAKSIDDCPPVSNFDVRAEGEASASPLVFQAAANLCTAHPSTIVDYTEISSVAGRRDFLSKLVDVGITSMPPTAAELAVAPGYPKWVYAPVDLTAVAVAYNMSDPVTHKRITDLTLSPRLLARVITDTGLTGPQSDKHSFWADPELNRLNPGHHWPSSALSQPLLRSEQNADTFFTTDWIAHDAAAEQFLHGVNRVPVPVNPAYKDIAYPTDVFQNVESSETGYLPIQGETPVARKLFYGVKPAEQVPQNPELTGFIGLVDLPTAERYDLPVAKLVNASGAAVAPDAAGITAGYQAMQTNADGITKAPNFATTAAGAYPLVKIDYAMIPTVARDAAEEASLKRVLDFAKGGEQANLPPGYLPLPAELVAQITAAEAKITAPPPPKTPTTTTTTTPPATPTVPLGDLGGLGGSVGGSYNGSVISDGSTSTTAPAGSTSTTTTPPAKVDKKKLSHAKSVVDITNGGERFGLPIVVLLALLAGLYPLSRRARVFYERAFAVARARLSRSPKAMPTSPAP